MSAQPVETVVAVAKPSKPRPAKPKPDPAETLAKSDAKATTAKPKTTPKKLPAAEERAVRLAQAAGEIAKTHGLKSAYLKGDAMDFATHFIVARSGQKVSVQRKTQPEPVELKLAALKTYVAKGEPEVAKAIRGLCGGTKLYGKKLAIFCLAALAQEEVA